jgi:hypothetical protein
MQSRTIQELLDSGEATLRRLHKVTGKITHGDIYTVVDSAREFNPEINNDPGLYRKELRDRVGNIWPLRNL